MSHLVKVPVKPGLGRHIRAGHPWVFKKAIEIDARRIPIGSVVDLVDEGRFCGRGYWDPLSAIAVRVLTTDPHEDIDAAFFERTRAPGPRVAAPADRLQGHQRLPRDPRRGRRAARAWSSISTRLRGDEAVLRGPDAAPAADRRGAARRWCPGSRAWWAATRWAATTPTSTPRRATGGCCAGAAAPQPLRDPRARREVPGRRVHRAEDRVLPRPAREPHHGAAHLEGPRRPQLLLLLGRLLGERGAGRGAAASSRSTRTPTPSPWPARTSPSTGCPPARHDFLAADAFELLESFKREGRKFDLIVLDPPAFAKSQKAVESALGGYASLNRQALAVLKPGGLLCTASCSARVSPEAFFDAVKDGAHNAGVDLTSGRGALPAARPPGAAPVPRG